MLSITGNLLEWSKWTMPELMDAPFTPMMLAINSFLEQQEVLKPPQNYVNLADKSFVSSVLDERPSSTENYEFE